MLASTPRPYRDVRTVSTMLRRATLLVMLAGCLVAPSLAHASGAAVIRDCEQNGELTGHYSQADLNSALHSMPADLKEYSNCEEAVQQAQAAAASKPRSSHNRPTGTDSTNSNGTGGGTSGGSTSGGSGGSSSGSASTASPKAHAASRHAATPADHKALQSARQGKTQDSGVLATTRAGHTGSSGSGGSLPTPLLVVLILLGAGALASLVVAGRRRRPRVRRVLARDRT